MTGLHTVQSRREFAFKNSQSPVERKKIVRVDPKFGIRLRIGRPGRRASAEPQCHVSICPQLASSFTNYKLVDYLPNLYNYINCNLFSLRLYRAPSISAGVALERISRGFSLRLSKRPSWRPSQRPSQRLSQAAARLYHRRSGHRPAISAAISPPGYLVTLTYKPFPIVVGDGRAINAPSTRSTRPPFLPTTIDHCSPKLFYHF